MPQNLSIKKYLANLQVQMLAEFHLIKHKKKERKKRKKERKKNEKLNDEILYHLMS